MPGMILLEPANRILEECVRSQIMNKAKKEPMDVRLCDFDDVSYRITVEREDPSVMKVSLGLPLFASIKSFGGDAAVAKHYGDFARKGEPEAGYDVTLDVKFDDIKDPEATIANLSLLKTRVTGGVFDHYFDALQANKKMDKFKFDMRHDTTIYVCPRDDRVTLVYAIDMSDKVDKAIAHVFFNEFVQSRKKIGRAPPCDWSVNPPRELAEHGVTENRGCLGYFTFAIMVSHLEKGRQQTVVDQLQTFRTYIQYHIKCSKSYFHSKMRQRVVELIKVLNRAKVPDLKKEKKLASGKTFKR